MHVKLTLSEKFDDLKLFNFYFYRMFPPTFFPSPSPSPSDVCVTHCTETESDWIGAKLRTKQSPKMIDKYIQHLSHLYMHTP